MRSWRVSPGVAVRIEAATKMSLTRRCCGDSEISSAGLGDSSRKRLFFGSSTYREGPDSRGEAGELRRQKVFVHFFLIGGSEGRWSDWSTCSDVLRAHGHGVTAFGWEDLPWGCGVDGVVDFLVSEVCRVREAVLVGHSAGGLLVPRVAREVEVVAEVYLAALVPQRGMGFAEQMFESPVEVFDAAWLESAYHAESREGRILQGLYETRFEGYAEGRRLYLVCGEDGEVRPEWQEWAAGEMPAVEVRCLRAGHQAHVTMAREVSAEMLGFLKGDGEF